MITGAFFMEDLTNNKQKQHRCMLTNRHVCNMNGVVDVLSFDLEEILLETDQGMLMIKGSNLHVNRLSLDKGEVDIEGKIDSLTYSENGGYGKSGESFLAKLFK